MPHHKHDLHERLLTTRMCAQGLLDCLAKLARSGGIPAMYRGLSASITGIIPYSGVDLTVYSLLRDLYAEKHPGESFGVTVPLTCGT